MTKGIIVPKCNEVEALALADAKILLKFAAERVDPLDPNLSRVIAESVFADQDGEWSVEISQKFWTAYSQLNNVIKPTTVESLKASKMIVRKSLFNKLFKIDKTEEMSEAEIKSKTYLFWLAAITIITITIQLYIWLCANSLKQLDSLSDETNTQFIAMAAEYKDLESSTSENGHVWSPDERKKWLKLVDSMSTLDENLSELWWTSNLLCKLTRNDVCSDGFYANHKKPEFNYQGYWSDYYGYIREKISSFRPQALESGHFARLAVDMLTSFVLPLLFGCLGAVAYVVRAISDQIKNITFLKSSPVRHFMRAALGATMGSVIGLFSGSTSQLNLSPLAVAFLAGYGVEGVFSLFDALIERLARPSSNTQMAPSSAA